MSAAQSQGAAFVVITGGEPLHHNLDLLCSKIRQTSLMKTRQSIPIHLETSGVDQLSGNPDWITLSPKRHYPPLREVLIACQELKVVIHDTDDLLFAEDMAAKTNTHPREQPLLFLQAGWNHKNGQELALEYVKSHPQWRLSMQTHKWLKVS